MWSECALHSLRVVIYYSLISAEISYLTVDRRKRERYRALESKNIRQKRGKRGKYKSIELRTVVT